VSTPLAVGSRFIVPFLGADVVKLAGLQQACISEVLLIDGITAFCVQKHECIFVFEDVASIVGQGLLSLGHLSWPSLG
jgi:hypothetical protein